MRKPMHCLSPCLKLHTCGSVILRAKLCLSFAIIYFMSLGVRTPTSSRSIHASLLLVLASIQICASIREAGFPQSEVGSLAAEEDTVVIAAQRNDTTNELSSSTSLLAGQGNLSQPLAENVLPVIPSKAPIESGAREQAARTSSRDAMWLRYAALGTAKLSLLAVLLLHTYALMWIGLAAAVVSCAALQAKQLELALICFIPLVLILLVEVIKGAFALALGQPTRAVLLKLRGSTATAGSEKKKRFYEVAHSFPWEVPSSKGCNSKVQLQLPFDGENGVADVATVAGRAGATEVLLPELEKWLEGQMAASGTLWPWSPRLTAASKLALHIMRFASDSADNLEKFPTGVVTQLSKAEWERVEGRVRLFLYLDKDKDGLVDIEDVQSFLKQMSAALEGADR